MNMAGGEGQPILSLLADPGMFQMELLMANALISLYR